MEWEPWMPWRVCWVCLEVIPEALAVLITHYRRECFQGEARLHGEVT